MRVSEIYISRVGERVSNIDVKQYEFKELSRKANIKSAIESMLFVSGEPLSLRAVSYTHLDVYKRQVLSII